MVFIEALNEARIDEILKEIELTRNSRYLSEEDKDKKLLELYEELSRIK